MGPRTATVLSATVLSAVLGGRAAAEPPAEADRVAMLAELDSLREANEALEQRLLELERRLAVGVETPGVDGQGAEAQVATLDGAGQARSSGAGEPQQPDRLDRLTLSGDLRVRYEANSEDAAGQARHRGVVRGRLAARWRVNDWLTAGARLVTGNLDDPNTADVTLSDFNDDIEVGLDQLFLRAQSGSSAAFAGKHPNIFSRTDLLWDGDVMLQGLAVEHAFAPGRSYSAEVRGAYFLIEEASGGDDSAMTGLQAEVAGPISRTFDASLALGYFHYDLGQLGSAGPGDFRGNRIGPNGRYVSEFDIANLIADMTVHPFGERWPLTGRLDLVRNFGAVGGDEDAWAVDVFAGRADQVGEYRVRYGYAEAERDAVFAAFSHDNIPLSTDYRLHTLSLDTPVADGVDFNLTAYVYSGLSNPSDWEQRARFNLVFGF